MNHIVISQSIKVSTMDQLSDSSIDAIGEELDKEIEKGLLKLAAELREKYPSLIITLN